MESEDGRLVSFFDELYLLTDSTSKKDERKIGKNNWYFYATFFVVFEGGIWERI